MTLCDVVRSGTPKDLLGIACTRFGLVVQSLFCKRQNTGGTGRLADTVAVIGRCHHTYANEVVDEVVGVILTYTRDEYVVL